MPATVKARLSVSLPEIPVGTKDDIQWMPPGTHEITPLVDGKPQRVTVRVTPEAAKRVADQLAEMRALAADGRGDFPFVDFNHEDGAAAGTPTEFYWAGDDPKRGGIRAKMEWTSAGTEALEGKVFRRFSPQWDIDPKSGEIVRIGVNVGGLVNRAAFRTIEPVAAKDHDNQDQETPMTDQEKEALKTLVGEAIAPLTTRLTALEAKASATPDATLANRVAALESSSQNTARAQAREAVDAAKRDGRIPSADEALAKYWEDQIVSVGEPARVALAKMQPNPALARATGGGTGGDHGADPATNFVTTIKAKAAAGKTRAEALRLTAAEHPEWHAAWLKADCQPALN